MTTLRDHGRRLPVLLALLASLLLLPAPVPAPGSGAETRAFVVAGTAAEASAVVVAAGGEVVDALSELGGVVADLSDAAARRVARAGAVVVPDAPATVRSAGFQATGPVDATLSVQATNPGAGWDGTAGMGIGVALVDTGVAPVADLAGRVVHGPDLSGEGDGVDRYGHGTFMAGLIAGDGTAGRTDGSGVGVTGLAPAAHIVSVKVAGADGATSVLRLLAAIDWVLEHREPLNIRVLNLSVGVDWPLPVASDPLSLAVEAAAADGVLVVAAAGNEGGTVPSPARHPFALAVGASDVAGTPSTGDDSVPSWSGSTPGTAILPPKPDVVAPGVSVLSLRAPGSAVDEQNPQARVGASYFKGTGTSMGTALTSGAAAVLAARHPEAGPADLRAALVGAADPVAGSDAGAIDVAGSELVPAPDGGPTVSGPGAGLALGVRVDGWTGTRWSGTRWSGTRWSGTRWSQVDWSGTRWSGTRWSGTRWSEVDWSGTRWSGTRWSEVDWSGTRWSGTRWSGTRWSGTRWSGTRWSDVDWSGTRWSGTRWSDAGWAGTRWSSQAWG